MKKGLKPVHLIHLLLYTPIAGNNSPVPIYGITRLMKMIFIFEKELSKYFQDENNPIEFDFEAYNFGPYSKKVYEAIDFLETRKILELLDVSPQRMSSDDMEIDSRLMSSEAEILSFQNEDTHRSEGFQLTTLGIKMMKNPKIWFSWVQLSEEKKKILTDFKTTMVNTQLKDILRYVYSKYPKYAEKSVIYQKLFPQGVFR
jgi:uncharacterized phage-associated protein